MSEHSERSVRGVRVEVTGGGTPTPSEVAAIVAAVESVWPKPAAVELVPPAGRNAWRWSGRWWGPRHQAADRRRPWR